MDRTQTKGRSEQGIWSAGSRERGRIFPTGQCFLAPTGAVVLYHTFGIEQGKCGEGDLGVVRVGTEASHLLGVTCAPCNAPGQARRPEAGEPYS